MIQDLRGVHAACFFIFIEDHGCRFSVKLIVKILRRDNAADLFEKLRTLDEPGEKQSLGLPDPVLLLLFLAGPLLIVLPLPCGHSDESAHGVHEVFEIRLRDHILPCNGFRVIITLQLFRKFQKLLRDGVIKPCLRLRVLHVVLAPDHGDFEHKASDGIVDPLLEFLFPKILDKLVRVLIGLHI